MRMGPADYDTEADFLSDHGITKISDNEYRYLTSDGEGEYTVRYKGPVDYGSDAYTWTCDCQAGRHGLSCNHCRDVHDIVFEWIDADGRWE